MQTATGDRLVDQLRGNQGDTSPAFRVDAARYRDDAWLARERATAFARPVPVLASSSLAPGACVPIDTPIASALLVRSPDNTVRAFRNACRHRGTRLVDAPQAARRAIVCPYHGWTYGLDGALVHAPHAAAFAPEPLHERSLHQLPVAEHHGLIWLNTRDPAGFLGDLDGDLAALDLASHAVHRTARTTRRCNWKLVVEAFLDGYHIRVLHRDSIYRFFLDAASAAERVGPHIRAVTGRRTLHDAGPTELRAIATPSLSIFPATTIIVHPDFVSLVTALPITPDTTDYQHTMLVPAARAGDTAHWDKSWSLIEDTVFQREDLWVCEQVQRGIAAGTDHLLFGALEHAVGWFHDELERAVATTS
jgi:phenylpropionate dioxygenase-like ring-hydroxylating dioxygenase large terminal subunit|nr:aromatic ring-hydroxylating dioxygenase subunit alpha [Kofleriaceae bacterium]